MAKGILDGLDKVLAAIDARTPKGKKKMRVEVGYTAPYALFVHENLQVHHPNGESKFLERAYRALATGLKAEIKADLANKIGLEEALTRAGEKLLASSNFYVPVDTGYLKSTGYVTVVDQE